MDKRKFKRIVAREGLVIIGLATFSLIVYLLAVWLLSIEFKSVYEFKFRSGETHKIELATSVKVSDEDADSAIPSNEELDEIAKKEFKTTLDNLVEKKLISKNLPLSLFPFFQKVAPPMRKVGILFFFITYPLYLLIRYRYIPWRVITRLKKLILWIKDNRILIVLWSMGLAICAIILLYPKKYFHSSYRGYQILLDEPCGRGTLPVIQLAYVIPLCLSILIIGALLIYTLRDKKK